MTTVWDKENNTLTILIDLRRLKVGLRRAVQFSFSAQVDDSDCGGLYDACKNDNDCCPDLHL